MPQAPLPRRCPGPGCVRHLSSTDPTPEFCSHRCAAGWRTATHPTDDAPIDHGAGVVAGASYGSGGLYERNRGSNVLAFAPRWLDARPRGDEEPPA